MNKRLLEMAEEIQEYLAINGYNTTSIAIEVPDIGHPYFIAEVVCGTTVVFCEEEFFFSQEINGSLLPETYMSKLTEVCNIIVRNITRYVSVEEEPEDEEFYICRKCGEKYCVQCFEPQGEPVKSSYTGGPIPRKDDDGMPF